MKVRFTGIALSQFVQILEFISQDDPHAARRFERRARTRLRRLERFPASGRRVPESPDTSTREILVGDYRFFYEIAAGTVLIVAVWHGARRIRGPS